MYDRDDGPLQGFLQPPVRVEKGGMIQFILEQEIGRHCLHGPWQRPRKVVGQVTPIVPPGEGEDLHPCPLLPEVIHQETVIKIAARDKSEASVDDEADIHGSAWRQAAHALPISKTWLLY